MPEDITTGILFSRATMERCDRYLHFSEIIHFIIGKYLVNSGDNIFVYKIIFFSVSEFILFSSNKIHST